MELIKKRSFIISAIIPPAVTFCICVIIGVAILVTAIQNDRDQLNKNMQQETKFLSLEIMNQLQTNLDDMNIFSRTINTWGTSFSNNSFAYVAQAIAHEDSKLISIGYSPKVLDADRSSFEATLSQESGRPTTIWSALENSTVPASKAPFYLPIFRMFQSPPYVYGMDVYHHPTMHAVIDQAVASGGSLISLITESSSVLLVTPIFRCPNFQPGCSAPSNITARMDAIIGVIIGEMNIKEIVKNTTGNRFSEYRGYYEATFCIGNVVLYQTATTYSAACNGRYSSAFPMAGNLFVQYVDAQENLLEANMSAAAKVAIAVSTFVIVLAPTLVFLFMKSRYDQTEAKIAMEKNTEREKGIAATEAMKRLLRCTSHDMRAPLQACINAVGLLKDEMKNFSSKLAASLMDVIMGSTTLLEGLMDNILDSSKLETSCLESIEAATRISPKIRNLVEIIRTASLIPNDVQLHASVDDIPKVLCDSGKILRIVMNLISNAAKFTKKGSITVSVKLIQQPDPTKVQVFIQVKDTGCGMTEEQISKLGTPYVHSSAAKGGGSGLGIYICKSYAEMYGGVFNVQSTVGQGTSISFTLTFSQVGADDDARSGGSIAPDKAYLDPARPLKVLYCEDHPITRKVMAMMLEKMGCSVEVAVDGLEASQKIVEGGPYDVVFMDMQMPHINGDEVVREFRIWESKNRPSAHTPIVALTGNSGLEDISLAKTAGCDHHLSKPCRQEQIAQVLESIRQTGLLDLQIVETVNNKTRITKSRALPRYDAPKLKISSSTSSSSSSEPISGNGSAPSRQSIENTPFSPTQPSLYNVPQLILEEKADLSENSGSNRGCIEIDIEMPVRHDDARDCVMFM